MQTKRLVQQFGLESREIFVNFKVKRLIVVLYAWLQSDVLDSRGSDPTVRSREVFVFLYRGTVFDEWSASVQNRTHYMVVRVAERYSYIEGEAHLCIQTV